MPLSYSEINNQRLEQLDLRDIENLATSDKIQLQSIQKEFFDYGGFPRAYLYKDREILAQYHQDVVEKDIALRRGVWNVKALKELGLILSSQNGRQLNVSSITKDLGIKSLLTRAKFLSYFQETYLCSRIYPFSRTRRKQIKGWSKYYAIDSLMALNVGFHQGDTRYWILENHVVNESIRRGYDVYFWHSKNG